MTVPNLPAGDLARVRSHESDASWPESIEIVAHWRPKLGKKRGRMRRYVIPADQFFGRGSYGAPLAGEQIIQIIERLRKG